MKKRMTLLIIAGVFLLTALAGCGGEKGEIKLLAQDANLEKAPQIVVEPDKAPYNLGGWQKKNEVSWKADIPKAGMYAILIEYSRPGGEPKAPGLIMVRSPGKKTENLRFSAEPTGKNNRDWSVYTINDDCGIRLEKGTVTLAIRPNFSSGYTGTKYFMNLRSVTLKLKEE
jgi:hypothetical protein